MKWRLPTLFALVLGCVVPAPVRGPVEGTYRFVLCEEDECTAADSASALAVGEFVLFPSASFQTSLPDTVLRELRRESRWLVAHEPGANACFRVAPRVRAVRGRELYAGIIEQGVGRWKIDDGQLTLPLYRSPDAAFALVGTVEAGTVRGTGEQFDWDGTSGPIGFFVARRTGPPTPRACTGS